MYELLAIGIATAFNFLVIKWKLEQKRFADVTVDVIILLILSTIFAGTVSGMVIAMIASAIVSGYLIFNPPTLPNALRRWDKR